MAGAQNGRVFQSILTIICTSAVLAAVWVTRKHIMATQAELAQSLRDMKAQNDKAHDEIVAKIAALEEALANAGTSTPEVDAALADLKASIQRDDDMTPDAEPQA